MAVNNSVQPTRYSEFFDICPQTGREIVPDTWVLLFVKKKSFIQIG